MATNSNIITPIRTVVPTVVRPIAPIMTARPSVSQVTGVAPVNQVSTIRPLSPIIARPNVLAVNPVISVARVAPIAPIIPVAAPVIRSPAVMQVPVVVQPPSNRPATSVITEPTPLPVIDTTITVTVSEKEWLRQLQLFLVSLLTPVFGNTKFFVQLFTAAAMVVWSKAFTHETVSPTDNYEDLEFNGDAILKAAFPKYLQYKLPKLHKKEYSELNIYYMSKIRQAELSKKMGLGKYIRVAGMDRAILNLETDVFESFFGALDVISNSIVEGLGYLNSYRMIEYLFQDITIDETKALGSSKTQVIQMFVRFDLPKVVESFEGEVSTEVKLILAAGAKPRMASMLTEGMILGSNRDQKNEKAYNEASKEAINQLISYGILTVDEQEFYAKNTHLIQFRVSLDRSHIDFLRSYGVNINDPVIGFASAATKREAELEAYNNALQTLARYGISTKWAEKLKQQRDFAEPSLQPYMTAVNTRLAKEGYISVRFFIPRKTTTAKGAIVQLVGLRSSGREEMLSTVYAPSDDDRYNNAKLTVIRQYARQ